MKVRELIALLSGRGADEEVYTFEFGSSHELIPAQFAPGVWAWPQADRPGLTTRYPETYDFNAPHLSEGAQVMVIQ